MISWIQFSYNINTADIVVWLRNWRNTFFLQNSLERRLNQGFTVENNGVRKTPSCELRLTMALSKLSDKNVQAWYTSFVDIEDMEIEYLGRLW